jgi:hypothetical protein
MGGGGSVPVGRDACANLSRRKLTMSSEKSHEILPLNSTRSTSVARESLIISPTKDIPHAKDRNIGHVGLLGKRAGNDRLVYSNSSKMAKFEQNFTVGSWKARYADTKKLDVLFYPVPINSMPATS